MIRPWTAPISAPSQAIGASIRALVPALSTPRTTLRAPVIGDFLAWSHILTSARAIHVGGPMDADDAWLEFCEGMAAWALRGHGMWTLTDHSGTVLGFVLLGFAPGDGEHELGYLLCEAAEGQGYVTEAAAAARDYAVSALRLPSLVSYISPENLRSGAVAMRLGATRDGMLDGCDIWRHHPKVGA